MRESNITSRLTIRLENERVNLYLDGKSLDYCNQIIYNLYYNDYIIKEAYKRRPFTLENMSEGLDISNIRDLPVFEIFINLLDLNFTFDESKVKTFFNILSKTFEKAVSNPNF